MIKEMEQEQEEFDENINNLELTIGGFDTNKKLEKYMEVAESVDNIDAKIKQCIEQASVYNARENLVNKPLTDYSKLKQLEKDFQPYSNMWKTARTWFESHKKWMSDPWEELDAPSLEDTFERCQKTINQVFRIFRDKGMNDMHAIAE
jgi:dynein heavy chain, axonemal